MGCRPRAGWGLRARAQAGLRRGCASLGVGSFEAAVAARVPGSPGLHAECLSSGRGAASGRPRCGRMARRAAIRGDGMGNLAWTVGDVSVTRVVEQEVPLPLTGLLPDAAGGVEFRARP